MTFGEEVKRLRAATGLTQGRLAEQIGVNQATISRIEGSERENVTPTVLYRLADALGVPVDHFRPYFLDTPPPVAAVGAGVGAGDAGGRAEPVRVISKRK